MRPRSAYQHQRHYHTFSIEIVSSNKKTLSQHLRSLRDMQSLDEDNNTSGHHASTTNQEVRSCPAAAAASVPSSLVNDTASSFQEDAQITELEEQVARLHRVWHRAYAYEGEQRKKWNMDAEYADNESYHDEDDDISISKKPGVARELAAYQAFATCVAKWEAVTGLDAQLSQYCRGTAWIYDNMYQSSRCQRCCGVAHTDLHDRQCVCPEPAWKHCMSYWSIDCMMDDYELDQQESQLLLLLLHQAHCNHDQSDDDDEHENDAFWRTYADPLSIQADHASARMRKQRSDVSLSL
jgi:hypothetical protein